ncbi:hypothetical protein CL689_04285 [Candidatus Saccharibacteria bacterium]|nr:hypothetical protein [Candidatus Saccharibacteria bacterium]|tara:strand:+ start:3458 stop:4222 length:765 start_codon:yes stop_codon:yes gene_type:complete
MKNEQPPTPEAQAPPQTPYHQPVAYDAEGRPLYAHPPTVHTAPQIVQTVRPHEPAKPVISEETKRRHEQSRRQYPFLNLSDGEYVIKAMRRHPIGLFVPMATGIILLALSLTVLFSYESIADSLNLSGLAADPSSIILPVLLFCVLIGLGMFIAYYVYVNNKFFLTNESVIQEIQVSLFSRHEQTVSLGNIEDASYRQTNIIQHLFNYGSIRLSTEGDETTYRFTYVANPEQHIAELNNAVEAFKLGRPVGSDD